MRMNRLTLDIQKLALLLLFLLAGCARSTLPAPTQVHVTVTVTPTTSPTSSPSSTPTPSRTPALTSTNTPIPLKPIRIGALGKGEMDWVMRSPDGEILLKAEPYRVRLFKAATEEEIGLIYAGVGPGVDIILSPDGKLGSLSGAAGRPIYDLTSARLVEQNNGDVCGVSNVEDMVFSPDNHYAVIRGYFYLPSYQEKHLCLLNVAEERYELTFPGTENDADHLIYSIGTPAISPDSRLVAAGVDHSVYVWELPSGNIRFVLEGHGGDVSGAAFSPNGRELATGSEDGTIRIWDPSSGKLLRVVTGFTNDIEAVAYSGDGRALIVNVKDSPKQTYDLQTGRFVPTEMGKNEIDPFARRLFMEGYTDSDSRVLYSPDGRLLAVGWESISLWEPATKTVARVLESTSGTILRWIFSPDSRWLAALTNQGVVLVWNTQNGELAFTTKSDLFSLPELEWYDDYPQPRGLAFSPAGDQLVFGSGNAVEFWSVPEGKQLRAASLDDGLKLASQMSFSPDGQQMAVLINKNEEVWIYDTQTLGLLRKISLPPIEKRSDGTALQWPWLMRSPSDRTDGQAELWNLETGEITHLNAPDNQAEPVLFSRDGQILVTVGVEGLYFFQTRTGHLLSVMDTQEGMVDAALSPDNQTLAITIPHYSSEEGSNTESVSLWDIEALARAAQNSKTQPFPLPTPSPTATPDPGQPIATPQPTLQVTPLPVPSLGDEALSPANAAQITQLASYSKGVIEQVTWSVDGKSYLVAAAQGAYWHGPAAGSLEPPGWTQSAAVGQDGDLFAASVHQRWVQVWRSGSDQPLIDLPGRSPALSPDGRWLLYAPAKHALRLVDLKTGQIGPTLRVGYASGSPYRDWGDDFFYRQPVFSPNSRLAAVVHYGTSIRVWDVQSGTIVDGLGGPPKTITQYAFSADSAYIAAAAGGSAWLWQLHTHALPERFEIFPDETGIPMPDSLPPPPLVTAAAFDPASRILAVCTNQGEILLIEASTKKVIRKLTGLTKTPDRLAFSPDGSTLLTTDTSGIINLWDVHSGENLSRVTDYNGLPRGLGFRLNGDLAAWSDNVDQVLALPDLTLKQSVPIPVGTIFADSPDGKVIAVADAFKIHLWNPATGQMRQTVEGGTNWADALGFKKEDNGAVFSSDGRLLAVFGTGGARIYDPATGKQVGWLHDPKIDHAVFRSDGSWLYFCSRAYYICMPNVREISTGDSVQELPMPQNGDAEFAAFSPDGTRIAAAVNEYDDGYDIPLNQLVLWDIATGEEIKTLDFPGQKLTSIAYSPSEQLIAVGIGDGRIVLVDVEQFKIITTLRGHGGSVLFLAFSPDGRHLASSGEDGTIRSWGLP